MGTWTNRRWALALLAAALAGAIFYVDLRFSRSSSIAVLYVVVILVGAIDAGRRAIVAWSAVAGGFGLLSFFLTHMPEPGVDSLLRLAFSLVAMAVTCGLLLSRLRLVRSWGELNQREKLIRELSDSVPLVLFRTGPTGSITHLNGYFTEFTGISAGRVADLADCVALFHPEDAARVLEERKPEHRKADRIRTHVRLRDREGEYRWMLLDRRPIRGPDGETTGWYGSLADIHAETSAREEIERLNAQLAALVAERSADLRRSEQRFRTLFQDLNYAFAEMDTSRARAMLDAARAAGATDYDRLKAGRPELIEACIDSISVVDMNQALLTLMGYADHAELAATPPPENGAEARQVLETHVRAIFERRQHYTGFTTLTGKDGLSVPVAFGVNIMEDWTRILATHVDLTEQHRAHAQMLDARAQMARANRAATIGALSTSLAHELNQPIQAVGVDLQTTLRWLDQEPPAMDRATAAIGRAQKNLGRVRDIVQRTREQLVAGRRHTEAVDLGALVRETSSLLAADLAARKVRLVTPEGEVTALVQADRVELQQVLTNLILNAAEAIGAPGRAGGGSVTVRILPGGPGFAAVEIEDDGPGIDPVHLESLFDALFTTKPDGVGLGLQICKTLIESVGGSISARNVEPHGALFRFTLPEARSGISGPDRNA